MGEPNNENVLVSRIRRSQRTSSLTAVTFCVGITDRRVCQRRTKRWICGNLPGASPVHGSSLGESSEVFVRNFKEWAMDTGVIGRAGAGVDIWIMNERG